MLVKSHPLDQIKLSAIHDNLITFHFVYRLIMIQHNKLFYLPLNRAYFQKPLPSLFGCVVDDLAGTPMDVNVIFFIF